MLSPCYRWTGQGRGWLSNLPTASQPVRAVKIQTWAVWLQSVLLTTVTKSRPEKHRFYNQLILCLKHGSASCKCFETQASCHLWAFLTTEVGQQFLIMIILRIKWDHGVVYHRARCTVCLKMAVRVTTLSLPEPSSVLVSNLCLQLSGKWPCCCMYGVFAQSNPGHPS